MLQPTRFLRPKGFSARWLPGGVLWLALLLSLAISFDGWAGRFSNVNAGPNAATVVLSGERIAEASLVTGDFNGDGYKEIVAGGQDGRLYVVAYNGSAWSVVWERQTATDLNAAGAPDPGPTTEIRAAPAVADLDGDGRLEIVLTTGGDPGHHKNGGVLVYTYNSAWSFSVVSGWPQPKLDIVGLGPGASDPDGYWDGIWGSPALGDLDGDGDLEVAVEGFDRRLHAWHHDGTVVDGWPVTRDNGDAILRGGWSSPAVGDIDDDGLPEVIFGTDSPEWAGEGSAPDYTKATLWAINGDSSIVPGFPVITDQTLQSSPALGDIDDDGMLEIVVGTGTGIAGTGGYRVYAWNGDGTPVSNWPRPTSGNMPGSPALGDLDGDGDLEVVIGCGVGWTDSCELLYAWHGDGSNVSGFPMRPEAILPWAAPPYNDIPYPPLLADYDGDGVTEILTVVGTSYGVAIVEPNGVMNPDKSRLANNYLLAAPVVDDVDDDGELEILVGVADTSGNHAAVVIFDETGTTGDALPWPTFHRDMRRTGNAWGVDATPPTNPSLTPVGHAVGAWSNDDTVQVNLAGATDADSGVRGYYYAWDTSTNTPVDRSAAFADKTNTSITSDPLSDGTNLYFHLRSVDYAGNLAIDTEHLGPFWIDASAPSSVADAPLYAAAAVTVTWGGSDAGPSGLDSYDVQVRQGAGGAWTTWLDDVSASTTQAAYAGSAGNTYYFRSVAQDVAGNVEIPPASGDASTTFTKHAFTGHVFNNQEEPVFMAQAQLNPVPSMLGEMPSDQQGAYGVYFDQDGNYGLMVQHAGFGASPSKQVSSGVVDGLDFYLPPANDFILDGNFEWSSGTLGDSGWAFGGTLTPTRTATAHTGMWGLLLQGSDAIVSQTLTLPVDLAADSLTLSWMASVTGTTTPSDALTVEVEVDGLVNSGSTLLQDMPAAGWTHGYLTIGAQAGQAVAVRLTLDAGAGARLRLDEISLGETRPGVTRVFLPLVQRP